MAFNHNKRKTHNTYKLKRALSSQKNSILLVKPEIVNIAETIVITKNIYANNKNQNERTTFDN